MMNWHAIVDPTGHTHILKVVEGADDEIEIARYCEAHGFTPASVQAIPESEQDAIDGMDRTFRNAWSPNGEALGVDMTKAREIQRQRMRRARAPLLAALDVEFIRADEAEDEVGKADVIARKAALRDVTADPAIEAARTPEALKAVWPASLKSG
jgi:hypothetical protein